LYSALTRLSSRNWNSSSSRGRPSSLKIVTHVAGEKEKRRKNSRTSGLRSMKDTK
jgi:hypothetical protein